MIIEYLKKLNGKDENVENEKLTYSSIPLTLALSKRKYDEEQRKKYKISKNKKAELL